MRVKADIQLVGRVQVVLSGGADQFSEFSANPAELPSSYNTAATSQQDMGRPSQSHGATSPGMLSSNEFWSETLRGRREEAMGSSLASGTVAPSAAPSGSQEDSAVMKILVEPSLAVVKGMCSVVDIQVIAQAGVF